MSDIALRFDGLLFAATILAGFAAFALAAVVAGIRALAMTGPNGLRRAIWFSLAYAVFSLLAFAVWMAFLEWHGAWTGADWIDYGSIPWLLFVIFGLLKIVRTARRTPDS